jgi:hypothetical protein
MGLILMQKKKVQDSWINVAWSHRHYKAMGFAIMVCLFINLQGKKISM